MCCLPVLLTVAAGVLRAQESVNSAGGQATGSGGTVSYSIGQVLYSSHTGSGGSEAQGVQQPFEIFVVSSREIRSSISLSIFPNPAVETLCLITGAQAGPKLRYRMHDGNGKLLAEEDIRQTETRIAMWGLPSASYVLKVYDEKNIEIQTFKIIKN